METGKAAKPRTWVIHPFLFALLPVLTLYSQNINLSSPRLLLRPMLLSVAVTLLLFLLLRSVLRDTMKCGLLVSTLSFFVFNYAPAAMAVYRRVRVPLLLFLACWVLAFLAFTLLFGLSRKPWRRTNLFLNAFTALAVAVQIFSIVRFEWRQQRLGIPRFPGDLAPLSAPAVGAADRGTLPDIYYIIVDGYGRDDVLRDIYRLDNSPFLGFLERRGFFVAGGARANYNQTLFSLASSLNMRYLHSLGEVLGAGSLNRRPLMRMIRDSDLARTLEARGYVVTPFASLYSSLAVRPSDPAHRHRRGLNDFEITLLNQTLLRVHFHAAGYLAHIGQVRDTLRELGKPPRTGPPRFVFAHIVCPHPPFVFSRDGGSRVPDLPFAFNDGDHYVRSLPSLVSYLNGYREQVQFINRELQAVIEGILQSPRPDPVIVLQADHGPGSRLSHDAIQRTDLRERLAILNAIRLPAAGYAGLYDTISPVNTFRFILNELFQARLPQLEDRSYFLNWHRPYSPIPVADELLSRREP